MSASIQASVRINNKLYTQHLEEENQVRIVETDGLTIILQGYPPFTRTISVVGPKINLKPLRFSKFPNILINLHDSHAPKTEAQASTPTFEDEDIKNPVSSTPNNNAELCDSDNRHIVELSIVFESRFCALYSGVHAAAVGRILSVIAEANEAYVRDTCLQLSVIDIEGYCGPSSADPYDFIYRNVTENGSTDIIYSFSTFHRENTTATGDSTFFFMGYDQGTTVAGQAFQPGTCGDFAYGYVEGVYKSSGVPSPILKNVLAHEVAHHLNAAHTTAGIMLARVNRDQFFFNANSTATMKAYVETDARASCITTARCDANTCRTACVDGVCVTPSPSPIPMQPFTSCKVAASAVHCFREIYTGAAGPFYQRVNCGNVTKFVRVPYVPGDPEILCCVDQADAPKRAVFNASRTTILPIFPVRNAADNVTYTFTNVIFPVSGYSTRQSQSNETFLSTLSATCNGPVMNYTPIPSPSPALDNGKETCGSAFNTDNHLACKKAAKQTIAFEKGGQVRVKLNVQFGGFKYKLVSKVESWRIATYDIRISTSVYHMLNAVKNGGDFALSPKRKVVGRYNVSIADMPRLFDKMSCCGKKGSAVAGVYVTLCHVTPGVGSFGKLTTIYAKIPCATICSVSDTVSRISVPMDETKKCPACDDRVV